MTQSAAVTITILADNTASPPFAGEHGFSAFLDFGMERSALLFDTGQGVLFENAAAAGVDLSRVGVIALSHGHYDHTNALPGFIARYPDVSVAASDQIGRGHWSLSTGKVRDIALQSASRSALESLPVPQRLLFSDRLSLFDGQLTLQTAIPRRHPLELPSPVLFADRECTVPDTVPEETVLCFRASGGLVILTGCCHAGLINTCEAVRAVAGVSEIDTVIGGFHLAGVSASRLKATADYLAERKVRQVCPCHCTGEEAVLYLEKSLGERVVRARSGKSFSFSL